MTQEEHMEWVQAMFPGQKPRLPATVMLEEAGELLQALSKRSQAAEYGLDSRYSGVDWGAEIVDALGDCGIAVCSLCNASGWCFVELMGLPAAAVPLDDPLYATLDLVTIAAAVVVDPGSRSLTQRYVELLRAVSGMVGVDLDRAVDVTWEQVRRRRK